MNNNEHEFTITLNSSRSFGGYEELTHSADYNAWVAIVENYSNTELKGRDEEIVNIKIDWSPALEYSNKLRKLYLNDEDKVISILTEDPEFFIHSINCSCTITFSVKHENVHPWYGDDCLQHLLYEIFLISNISCPGSFNLYRSYIRAHNVDPKFEPFAQKELELSEYLFEQSWHAAQTNNIFKIEFLDFNTVYNWYNEINIGLRQVAKTKNEKLLFTFLHLSKTSFLEPEATLWLASTLEEVFETSTGSSFRCLIKRLSCFLNINETDTKNMNKQLRKFYDVRNGFSHGGSPVCHPMAHGGWDNDVNLFYNKYAVANNYACALLLSVTQEFIRRDIKDINFKDELVEVTN